MIKKILYYIGEGTNPYENLAMEKYLTERAEEGECILYLWQNRHTVVIGKNQNAWEECRTTELERDGGFLSRRLSGGGAVYHDLGNLCFTFCLRTEDYDQRKQQEVIVAACRSLGIPAEISGRNDILSEGRKFSGNSFYHHGDESFHNGTLLVNVDMANLGQYLSPSKAKLESKGVASVRSRVVNLCDINPDVTIESITEAMVNGYEEVYEMKAERLYHDDFDEARLKELTDFFSSWEWIYGKKLPFTCSMADKFEWGEIELQFAVKSGKCEDIKAYTDSMFPSFIEPLEKGLKGERFTAEDLCRKVETLELPDNVAVDICTLLREKI